MALDFSLRLLSTSPFQSGQLLGHILLTKLLRSVSQSGRRLSDLVYRKMPISFTTQLSGQFDDHLEHMFYSDHAITNWGMDSLDLEKEFEEKHWVSKHRSIMSYLLAWDALFTLLTSAKPSNRAQLLNMLLTGPASYCFDRLLLVLGQLLPTHLINQLIVRPCTLEIDERLMIQSLSRTKAYLIAAGIISGNSSKRSKRTAKIKRLPDPGSCQDISWDDIFNCVDPLVQLPHTRSSSDLAHFSVYLLRRLLFEFPALIRDWYVGLSALDKQQLNPESPFHKRAGMARQLATQFDRVITRHFAKFVGRLSITLVQQLAVKQEDMISSAPSGLLSSIANMAGLQPREGTVSVKTRLNTLEILTTYHVSDDHSLEMMIQLPERYPLETVQLHSGRRKGLSCEQWRAWLHQLSLFLNHQNGSILEGIKLWHKNIKKKFEGIEECAICYSIVNNKNFTLPKMRCRVCRKAFHHSCMYKWFSSSRNPTCPMCRNLFFANNFASGSSS